MRKRSSSPRGFFLRFQQFLALTSIVTASPTQTQQSKGSTVELVRRARTHGLQTEEDGISWLHDIGAGLEAKYGGTPSSPPPALVKRGTGTNQLVNQNMDAGYYGSLAIGTPPTAYNVILDTGSADLWLASGDCTGCDSMLSFNSKVSSTFKNSTTPFSIQYGSGAAAGYLASDTVQMAGFGVSQQTFALCDQVTPGLLKNPLSGLLGLAFSSISTAKAMPFWQTLVENDAWDEPLMAFWLTRFIGVKGASKQQLGGAFNMGFTNRSLYTGDIQYTPLSSKQTYWLIPMTNFSVNGNPINIGSPNVAVDTGTTLIGGPASAIAAIYAQIPGSMPAGDNYRGYYKYPCSTQVDIFLTFGGGRAWPVDPRDFALLDVGDGYCIGSLFVLNLRGNSGLQWIIGDTFLKNVYSVFRYSPPSVGFATLSFTAVSQASVDAPVPTPSIGNNVKFSAATDRHDYLRFSRTLASSIAVLLSLYTVL